MLWSSGLLISLSGSEELRKRNWTMEAVGRRIPALSLTPDRPLWVVSPLPGADWYLPQQLRWLPQHGQRLPCLCHCDLSQPRSQEGQQGRRGGTDRRRREDDHQSLQGPADWGEGRWKSRRDCHAARGGPRTTVLIPGPGVWAPLLHSFPSQCWLSQLALTGVACTLGEEPECWHWVGAVVRSPWIESSPGVKLKQVEQ